MFLFGSVFHFSHIGCFPSTKFLLFPSLGSVSLSCVKVPKLISWTKWNLLFLWAKHSIKRIFWFIDADISEFYECWANPITAGVNTVWLGSLRLSGFLHKYQGIVQFAHHLTESLVRALCTRRRPHTDSRLVPLSLSSLQWPELVPPRGGGCLTAYIARSPDNFCPFVAFFHVNMICMNNV